MQRINIIIRATPIRQSSQSTQKQATAQKSNTAKPSNSPCARCIWSDAERSCGHKTPPARFQVKIRSTWQHFSLFFSPSSSSSSACSWSFSGSFSPTPQPPHQRGKNTQHQETIPSFTSEKTNIFLLKEKNYTTFRNAENKPKTEKKESFMLKDAKQHR